MALTIVTGAPFSGKSDFARSEIARREEENGELGLILVGFTELYRSMFPGDESQLRDEAVSDSGAPRLTAYVYAAVVAQAAERELSGFITTDSPRRAIEIADRIRAEAIVDVHVDVEDIARRTEAHINDLSRMVTRATRSTSIARCRGAAVTYLRERPQLVGRARVVRRRGRRWEISGNVEAFDEAAFVRGLTPAGRRVRDELLEAGSPAAPADVLSRLLSERGR